MAAFGIVVQLPGLGLAVARLGRDTPAGAADTAATAATACGIVAAGMLLLPWRGPAVVAVVALAIPAIALAPGPPLATIPAAFAVARAVSGGAALWAWSSLAGTGLVGVASIVLRGGAPGGIRVLVVTIVLCVVAAAAAGATGRRERFRAAAREEASRRRSAAEEERLRIARDLHDVLAHSLSQISVQAGVGLHLFDEEPTRAKESLRSIRETSAAALEEVREVLGVLRDGSASGSPRRPSQGLRGIPALLDEARSAGIAVHPSGNVLSGGWRDDGSVSTAVQLAAFRIVQESLTNVRRHAEGATARVLVQVDSDSVSIRVQNGPTEHETGHQQSVAGRGILGMRERAAALGGTLEAARADDGGFLVTARLPARAGLAA